MIVKSGCSALVNPWHVDPPNLCVFLSPWKEALSAWIKRSQVLHLWSHFWRQVAQAEVFIEQISEIYRPKAGNYWPQCDLKLLWVAESLELASYLNIHQPEDTWLPHTGETLGPCLTQIMYHLRFFQLLSLTGSQKATSGLGALGLFMSCPRPGTGSSRPRFTSWPLLNDSRSCMSSNQLWIAL